MPFDERTRALAAASARQRASLAAALMPWRSRAQRFDGGVARLRRHAGWIGFFAGFGAGMLVMLRPRWLLPSPRVVAAAWPFWRLLRLRRDRPADEAPPGPS